MGALILFAMLLAWFGLGVVLWRWLWIGRGGRQPVATHWMLALGALWMLAPWVDEAWGSLIFKRECEALPALILNIPVAVGAGEFFDEKGGRKLWTYNEIEHGQSPLPADNSPLAAEEDKKFTRAFDRVFARTTSARRIRSFPVPIIENTSTRVHVQTGRVIRQFRMLASPGGWVSRLTGWGSHASYTCMSAGTDRRYEEWIKFR